MQTRLTKPERVRALRKEADELLSILWTSRDTARRSQEKQQSDEGFSFKVSD